MVAAVDHRDVDGLAAEESEREQPAEAASDDDDAMAVGALRRLMAPLQTPGWSA